MATTANPLDEFDTAPAPQDRMGLIARAGAPVGAAAASQNPLDEFDPQPRGVATTFLGHVNQALANVATAPFQIIHKAAEASKAATEAGADTTPIPGFKLAEAIDPYLPKAWYGGGWLDQPAPQTTAEKYAAAAGSAVGYSALPEAGFVGKAEQLAKLAPTTVPRAFGQAIGEQYATAPGRAVAASTAAATSSGVLQEAAHEAELGPGYEIAAGFAAPIAPVAGMATASRVVRPIASLAERTVSPTLARWSANGNAILRKTLGYDQPYPAGYVGGRGGVGGEIVPGADFTSEIPPTTDPGTRAQALQILANTWRREGKTVDDVEKALNDAANARRLNSNSYAQDVQALADVTPGTQRLAGALYRSSPEVANRAIDFTYARQTGLVPDRGLPENSGLPAIPAFGKPFTGAEAKERFGSQFNTAQEDIVPTGMYQRVRRAFMRANEISDEDYHGHAANANRTDEAILDAAQQDAKSDFGAVSTAGTNVDVRPTTAPILQKWWQAAEEYPGPVAGQIKRAIGLFLRSRDAPVPPVSGGRDPAAFEINGRHPFTNIEQFQKAKEYLDNQIGKLLKGGDTYVAGRVLTPLKNELLDAVDGIQENNLGSLYSTARGKFAGRMEGRRMLQAGRDSIDNPEEGIDTFRSAGDNKGSQKLFRLGQVGAFEKKYGRMPASTDVTKFFDSPNVMSLLSETLPASERSTAVFADRPLRFGRYLSTERQMLSTPRKVIGGSPTAERLADDAALDSMNQLIEQFHGATGASLKTPLANMTWEGMGMQAVSHVLNKFFGYRADAAAELGRMLFTADPTQRASVLAGVRARMGPDRFSYFSQLMQQQLRGGTPARGAAAVTPGALGSAENPHRPTSPEEADTYPSGTHFYTPDGRLKVKP